VEFATAQNRPVWLRLGIGLAAAGLVSACVGVDTQLDSAPAWLQDDSAVVAPQPAPLEDAV